MENQVVVLNFYLTFQFPAELDIFIPLERNIQTLDLKIIVTSHKRNPGAFAVVRFNSAFFVAFTFRPQLTWT